MPTLIVVDGPAAAGKGTLAKALAQVFDFVHIDSGLIYRAVASMAIEADDAFAFDAIDAALNLELRDLKRGNLRSAAVGAKASMAARIPEVRLAVNHFIERLIDISGGCVMDGRAGAWEYPHAQVKLFITCDLRERARRRVEQIRIEEGRRANFEEVLLELEERDERDMNREVAPLLRAPASYQIDTTSFSQEKVLEYAIAFCKRELPTLRTSA